MAFSYFLKENLVSKHRQMITKTTRTHTPPTHAHTATYTGEDFDYLILFDYFLILRISTCVLVQIKVNFNRMWYVYYVWVVLVHQLFQTFEIYTI